MPIIVSKKKSDPEKITLKLEPNVFTLANITNIQIELHLSNNKTLKLASNIRKTTKNRTIIKKNLKANLNHTLDDFFQLTEMEFDTSAGLSMLSEV